MVHEELKKCKNKINLAALLLQCDLMNPYHERKRKEIGQKKNWRDMQGVREEAEQLLCHSSKSLEQRIGKNCSVLVRLERAKETITQEDFRFP